MQSNNNTYMTEPLEDTRNRPVVFRTHAAAQPRSRRRPIRVLATITLVLAAMAGATGLAFGGSAVWSVIGPKAPANEPAPLWLPEPTPIGPAANKPAAEFDVDSSTSNPPTHANSGPPANSTKGTGTTSTEPGDARRGRDSGTSGSTNPSSGSGHSGKH